MVHAHTSLIYLARVFLLLGLLTIASPPAASLIGAEADPTPTSPTWTSITNTAYGYTLRFPSSWTAQEETQLDNATKHLLSIHAPGQTGQALLTLRVTRQSFTDALNLVRHELDGQPARQVHVAGRTSAEVLGPAYDGGMLRVVVLPADSGSYVLAFHAADEQDPLLARFDQVLATFQVAQQQHLFLPLSLR
jgi:hypothetical protein